MSDFFPEKESGQAVMLVFETVIDNSQLLDFKHFTSLELELSESNTDFIHRRYLVFDMNIYNYCCPVKIFWKDVILIIAID